MRLPKEESQPTVAKAEEVEMERIPLTNDYKPFMEIEEPKLFESKLELFNVNPNYVYRWKDKNVMSHGRSGIWRTVDRFHSDFKGLRTAVDHTPSETFFSINELVLCCCHKGTAVKRREKLQEFNSSRDRIFAKRHAEIGDRLAREGSRMSKKTVKEIDDFVGNDD